MARAIREKVCPEWKAHYLGNGIDVARFRREDHVGASFDLRSILGIPPEAPVVGIVGRLTFEKGYREFIEAAAIVHCQLPGAHFVAIGPDDAGVRVTLEGQIARLGLEGCFRWLGVQSNMPAYYAMMSVLALLSYREGLPRVLMEAAASSIPVVASDIPACREIVEPGRTGLLVAVGDSRALAGAVLEILADPERAREMGENGRRKAEREFDQLPVFERVHNAYAELLFRRNRAWFEHFTWSRFAGRAAGSQKGEGKASVERRLPLG